MRDKLSALLSAKVSDMLDIPLEGISSGCCITLNGNREAVVSGCSGVMEYSADQIILRCKDGAVVIDGRTLTIGTLIRDQITVHGRIHSVDIRKTGEGAPC